MSSEPISPSNLPPLSCFGAPERLLQQRERLEACGDLLRAIDDFADADDDGDAVFGEGGVGIVLVSLSDRQSSSFEASLRTASQDDGTASVI